MKSTHLHCNMKKTQLHQIMSQIQKQGLRRTGQRKALIECLLKLKAPTAIHMIYQGLPKKTCDLATIYRSLQQLEEMNLVQRTYLSNGTALFSLRQEPAEHTHHIQCKSCEKVVPIDSCLLKDSTKQLKKLGFTGISHRLEFFGFCAKCTEV